MILSRGLLEPWPCLLVVHSDTVAKVVHVTDLRLAFSVTPFGTDLVRRHRPRVVDRHAFAPEVDGADGLSCKDVALVGARKCVSKVRSIPFRVIKKDRSEMSLGPILITNVGSIKVSYHQTLSD